MANDARKVSNPLTLIALFAGVSESTAVAILPFLAKMGSPLPSQLIWFVVLYPVLIVILFFLTLWTKHHVLYAPGDFPESSDFLKVLQGGYRKPEADGSELKQFWKPDGKTVDQEHANIIREWMSKNGIGNVSISGFVYSRDNQFIEARKKLMNELSLEND